MGEQPVKALIERLSRTSDPQQRAWLAGILAAIGKPAVDPILDARGRAEDKALRVWLASSLAIIGDAKALDLVKQLPRDEQPTPESTEATRTIFIRIQQYV
jgi:HEAT repeat protein